MKSQIEIIRETVEIELNNLKILACDNITSCPTRLVKEGIKIVPVSTHVEYCLPCKYVINAFRNIARVLK